MQVRIGREAPQLVVTAYRRDIPEPVEMELPDRDGRWTVLFFYPADFTFVCPTELRAFAALEDEFAAEDAVLVGASTDGYHCHRAWFDSDAAVIGVRYPVVADTDHRLSRAFGVLDDDGLAQRATFIVDPEGVVRHASFNDRSVGRAAGEALRLLRALKTQELCPVDWEPGVPTLGLAA